MVLVLDHPLVQDTLARLRQAGTSPAEFRRLAHRISLLIGYEALRDLPLEEVEIETPLERAGARVLAGRAPCLVSVLRAGDGLLGGMLELIPAAVVGHIGLARDPGTLKPDQYYLKLPDHLDERLCIVADPMLATGNSAIAAVSRLKEAGARRIRLACLLAAPEGIAQVGASHPDVVLITAAIDRGLDQHGYIRPGLGDAGDRLFGTS